MLLFSKQSAQREGQQLQIYKYLYAMLFQAFHFF